MDLEPVRRLIDGHATIPVSGDDPRSFSAKKVFTAARIPDQGNLQGYLYVILGGETYDSVVQKLKASYILQLSAWMIFASLLFALIAGLVLFASLTGRLKRLANAMDAFRSGARQTQIYYPSQKSINRADEIDRLGLTVERVNPFRLLGLHEPSSTSRTNWAQFATGLGLAVQDRLKTAGLEMVVE